MSWIHWQGARLPITRDDTHLELRIQAPDLLGAPVVCNLELHQTVPWPPGTQAPKLRAQHFFDVSIDALPLRLRHWQDFSGLVLRSTAPTFARMDPFDGYGNALEHHLVLWECRVSHPDEDSRDFQQRASVHYELRFGTIDGFCVPCEIDAWNLLPMDEFWRDQPETAAELAAFPTGEPDLRILTRAVLTGGAIEMARSGDKPAARKAALNHLHASIGGIQVQHSSVHWPKHFLRGDQHPPVELEGWRSTVAFWTPVDVD